VNEFCGWVAHTLHNHDLIAMLDYRARAPGAARAHPTDEHFLPIYFALGAAGWGTSPDVLPQYISQEVIHGTLSMDAFSFS
jgi:4,5-DOPA dioxygenase extradiol